MSDFKVGDIVMVRHNLIDIDSELVSLECYTPGLNRSIVYIIVYLLEVIKDGK